MLAFCKGKQYGRRLYLGGFVACCMAHLYRLVAYVLLALTALMLFLPPAHAFSSSSFTASYGACGGITSDKTDTAAGACSSLATKLSDPSCGFGTNSHVYVDNPTYCEIKLNDGRTLGYGPIVGIGGACPVNSTGTSSCTCNTGFVENATHNGCTEVNVEKERCAAAAIMQNVVAFGQSGKLDKVVGLVASGAQVCNEQPGAPSGRGCLSTFQRDIAIGDGPGGAYNSYGHVTVSGGADAGGCSTASTTAGTSTSPSVTPTAAAAPAPCVGGSAGMVNGVSVCIPFSSSPAPTVSDKVKTESSTAPTGEAVEKKTSETTVCTNGSCTTTTNISSTTGAAASSSTASVSQSKGEYCASKPQATECGGSGKGSGFGGACKAGFTCDGDAVQCAAAKEQYTRNCQIFENETPEVTAYNAMRDAERSKTGAQYSSDTVSITSESFKTDNILGVGASCIADRPLTMTVAGHTSTVMLPFSTVCPYLRWLGFLNIALSFLLAARIVGRG